MKIWIYWSKSKSRIYLSIFLNKNWKIYQSEQNFTGLGPEDWCSLWGLGQVKIVFVSITKISVQMKYKSPSYKVIPIKGQPYCQVKVQRHWDGINNTILSLSKETTPLVRPLFHCRNASHIREGSTVTELEKQHNGLQQ